MTVHLTRVMDMLCFDVHSQSHFHIILGKNEVHTISSLIIYHAFDKHWLLLHVLAAKIHVDPVVFAGYIEDPPSPGNFSESIFVSREIGELLDDAIDD